ncbi:hypothetical protein QBC38DRAFT_466902 [Podospora fimiseda]|uniref:Uncharacterized protein n=1 Tax=Podospora fimiseda TaxID=252190 RepID=A0AAN7BXD2_9PEZI|nr:hypothetical protein QBC38DRAFT_466902 [Podospora fimiseda]
MSSDTRALVSVCLALIVRGSQSGDHFNNVAIQFPAAFYARRGVSELVDRLTSLGARIEAGAPTLPSQIQIRLLDLLKSLEGVFDDLDKSDENTNYLSLSIVRIDFHKKALIIALDLVNLSIRIHAIKAGYNSDTQGIGLDTGHILLTAAKLQASIAAIQCDTETHPNVTEKTVSIKRFIQSAVTYLHIQRDEIGLPSPDDASSASGVSSSQTNVSFSGGANLEATHLYDTPGLSDQVIVSFDTNVQDKNNSITIVDQQNGNKRIIRYDQGHEEGTDLRVPSSFFGNWTRCSPDGTVIFRGDEETFSVYSITRRLRLGGGDCGCMVHFTQSRRHKLWQGESVFSADSRKMALAFSTVVTDNATHEVSWKARIWRISHDRGKLEELSKIKGNLPGNRQQQSLLTFSPDGTRIAAVCCKRQIGNEKIIEPTIGFAVWDVSSGALLHVVVAPLEITEALRLRGKVMHQFEWGGRWVLAVWFEQTDRLVIWDINASKIIFDRNLYFLSRTGKGPVQVGVGVRGSDVIVVRTVMGCVQVWNATHSQMLGVVQDADWVYDQPSISPDGKFLLARAERKDKSLGWSGRVWKLSL